MDVPQTDHGASPLFAMPPNTVPAFSADTNSLAHTSGPLPDLPGFSLCEGVYIKPLFDSPAVGNVDDLMREAEESPIGSVRGHAWAHVKVDYSRGSHFLNGKPVSLEELRREFARLGQIGGAVFYYKENFTAELPREAEAVIAAICEARLPVTFAARDYDPTVKVAEYFLPEDAG